jgi:signal peptidase II
MGGVPTSDPPPDAAAAPVAQSRRLLLPILLLAVVVVLVDQLSKWWAESTLDLGVGVPVLGEFIQWRLYYNPGAAFGLAGGFTPVLTAVAAAAVVALVVFATRVRTASWAIGIAALLGGATSHLGDRLLRDPGFARGHVVDFIDYYGFFIGNVADIALVGGAVYLVLLNLLGVEPAPEAR